MNFIIYLFHKMPAVLYSNYLLKTNLGRAGRAGGPS